jgi:large subunit ribosomal protein L5
VRDFKGVNRNGFDGRGNFNFGLNEQLVFTEVDYDNIIKVHGMNINISTTTDDDKQAERMLELIGFPFTKGK